MTTACYMPAYFNSHKEEIDAKEKAIGDAGRPAHDHQLKGRVGKAPLLLPKADICHLLLPHADCYGFAQVTDLLNDLYA
jgi:hypothetical protein